MENIARNVAEIVQDAFGAEVNVVLTRPEPKFGDFATNVALQLAGKLGRNPHEIAEELAAKLRETGEFSEVSVAGPGFINLRLSDKALVEYALREPTKVHKGKTIVTEYSDPNPFKVLHAGHLYTSIVGDVISNLLENAGATVHRVNFGGDVGLHVAKTMWAILKYLQGADVDKLMAIPEDERSSWMASCYVQGTQAYEQLPELATEGSFVRPVGGMPKLDIVLLNRIIYSYWGDRTNETQNFPTIVEDDRHISSLDIYKIYEICRKWSYDYFDAFYARIGTPFEKYYPESQTALVGLRTVQEQLQKGVFTDSDGAVVFEGEKYGLHTRVFINSEGLPTYEAKDVGLSMLKWEDYHFDESVIITGNDITEYMKVVLKAIEQFKPELSERTKHLTHGNVKLAGGVKMSSRKGNFLRAIDVIDIAGAANEEATGGRDERVVLAAIRYSFLKNRIGADIIFEPKESVSLQGNSGPYLQYAHARACSILQKSSMQILDLRSEILDLELGERSLLVKLGEYAEVVEKATNELLPHQICTYLYELAQEFNRFYEKCRIIGDEREGTRLSLTIRYRDTLANGLSVLGIAAPEKM